MRDNEFVPASVIERGKSVELFNFFTPGKHMGIVGRIPGQNTRFTVHHIRFSKKGGREKFPVETCTANQLLRNRFVKINNQPYTFPVRGNFDSGCKIIIIVFKLQFNRVVGTINGPVDKIREDIPLFRSVHKPDTATGAYSRASKYQFYSCCLFVAEHTGIIITVNQYINAFILKIFQIIDLKILPVCFQSESG